MVVLVQERKLVGRVAVVMRVHEHVFVCELPELPSSSFAHIETSHQSAQSRPRNVAETNASFTLQSWTRGESQLVSISWCADKSLHPQVPQLPVSGAAHL